MSIILRDTAGQFLGNAIYSKSRYCDVYVHCLIEQKLSSRQESTLAVCRNSGFASSALGCRFEQSHYSHYNTRCG